MYLKISNKVISILVASSFLSSCVQESIQKFKEEPPLLTNWGYAKSDNQFLADKSLRAVDVGTLFECPTKTPCKMYKIFGKKIEDNETVLIGVESPGVIQYLSYYISKPRWASLGQYFDILSAYKNIDIMGNVKPTMVGLISDTPTYWDGHFVWDNGKTSIRGSFVCVKPKINFPRKDMEIKNCNPISFSFSNVLPDKSKFKKPIQDWQW